MFEAIILAGGQGTRLKSVTGEIPKPMVDVNGKPFLYKLIERLEEKGCSKVVLSLGYRADYIVSRVKNEYHGSCLIDFVIEDCPLGTGGGIKLASKKINSDKFIVLNGDTYCELDYSDFLRFSEKSDLAISGVRVDDVSRYGTLEVNDNSFLISMHEKGSTGEGLINSGIYAISKKVLNNYHKESFSFEKDLISGYQDDIMVYEMNGYFIDIGIPADYYIACSTIQ